MEADQPWRKAAYWLVPHDSLSLHSYVTQGQLPRGHTTNSGLVPLTSVINQESTLMLACRQTEGGILSTEIHPLRWL